MEKKSPKRFSHKEWRRQAKKERRKRHRQKAARARDEENEKLNKLLESDKNYIEWIENQNKLLEEKQKIEELEHAEKEKAWLEAEKKAQEEWLVVQERKAKARQVQLLQEEKLRKEFEEMQSSSKRRRESDKRRRDESHKISERLRKEIDDYIDNGVRTPEALRSFNETQPRKEICPFFAKTGACRYGDVCSRNHQKPMLSTKICVPGFYTHFSLEKHRGEYDTDINLEYESRETRNHFRDFYKDVVPELEKFGKIRTLQYCKNSEPHLRGNLYIEYDTEREAARAVRGLRGRWYAGRQLNCEFVTFKSWRGAVCGMARCPKGSACNFLHVFKNPSTEYDVKSPPLWTRKPDSYDRSDRLDSFRSDSNRRSNNRNRNWDDHDTQRRNWRWSESPEPRDRKQSRFGQNNNSNRSNFSNRYQQRGRQDNRRFDNRNSLANRRNFDTRNRFSRDGHRDNRNNRQDNRFQSRYNGRSKRRYSYSDSDEDRSKTRRRSGDREKRDSRSASSERRRSTSRGSGRDRKRYSDSGSDRGGRRSPGDKSRSPRSRSPRSRSRSIGSNRDSRSPARSARGDYSDRKQRSITGSPPPVQPDEYDIISKTSDVEAISEGSKGSHDNKRKPAVSKWDDKAPEASRNSNKKNDREKKMHSTKDGDHRSREDYEWNTTESEEE